MKSGMYCSDSGSDSGSGTVVAVIVIAIIFHTFTLSHLRREGYEKVSQSILHP